MEITKGYGKNKIKIRYIFYKDKEILLLFILSVKCPTNLNTKQRMDFILTQMEILKKDSNIKSEQKTGPSLVPPGDSSRCSQINLELIKIPRNFFRSF